MHALSKFIAALAFVCASSSPLAATSGHVSQGGLAYTMLDLDPLDGISPELTFLPLRYPIAAYISSYYYYNGVPDTTRLLALVPTPSWQT